MPHLLTNVRFNPLFAPFLRFETLRAERLGIRNTQRSRECGCSLLLYAGVSQCSAIMLVDNGGNGLRDVGRLIPYVIIGRMPVSFR